MNMYCTYEYYYYTAVQYYVAIANPFKNQIEVQLTDQDGTALANVNNKDWALWLCVYVPPQVDILTKNMPALNY